eukprot:PITA_30749
MKEKKKDDASKSDDKSKTKKALKCWICAEPHTILGVSTATEVISRRDPERNSLEHVWMNIGSVDIITMVDSGATHNFMSKDTARRIGLKFVPVKAQMKTVNSPPDCFLGVAEKVDTKLGELRGKVDFTIVWIDDYEVVLGMEFLKQFDVVIVPHLNRLFIYNGREDVPIGVPTIGVTKPDCKLVVMQVEDEK